MASANGLGFGLFGKPIPVGFPSSEPQPFLFSCRGKWLAGPAMPSPNLHEVRAPGGGEDGLVLAVARMSEWKQARQVLYGIMAKKFVRLFR